MVLRILLSLLLVFSGNQNHTCHCMNLLSRSLAYLNPLGKMGAPGTNPLVGTTLSKEALGESLLTHTNQTTSLGKLLKDLPPSYKGLVLFLFPSAGTPGCTKQACNFTASHQAFKDRGYEVYGLTSSERTPAGKWTEKHNLTFTTLVDKDMKVVDHLDCRKLHMFVNRSHLVLSREGKVLAFEKGVNAEASASRVLELLDSFN